MQSYSNRMINHLRVILIIIFLSDTMENPRILPKNSSCHRIHIQLPHFLEL